MTLDLGRGEPRQQFIMQPKNRFRVGQHHVALRRASESHVAAFMMEQDFADNILKALNLQTDRGLCSPEPTRCLGNAAGIGDRYQRTQRPDIEAEKVHRFPFCLRLAPHLDPAMQTSCKRDIYRAQSLCTSLPPYVGYGAVAFCKRARARTFSVRCRHWSRIRPSVALGRHGNRSHIAIFARSLLRPSK